MPQCKSRTGHLPITTEHAEDDKAAHVPIFPTDLATQARPSTRCACSQHAPPRRAVGSIPSLTLWSTKQGQSAVRGSRWVLTACWLSQP